MPVRILGAAVLAASFAVAQNAGPTTPAKTAPGAPTEEKKNPAGSVPKTDQPKTDQPKTELPKPDAAKAGAANTDAAKPADYSQEAVVVEKLRRVFRFENDGTGSSTIEARMRVQTQAGVQQLGQLVWGYNSANEKLDIVFVRVTRPDGTVVNAPQENFQDVPSQIEREAPSYTDYRERHITVPALRPGEVLEYQVKTTVFSPLIPKQFWFEYTFRKDVITVDEQLEVSVPKDRKLKVKTKPDFAPKTATEGDRVVYRWTSNYLKRESDEERKKKLRKKAREDFYPDIALTTFQSWEELGTWYAGLQRTQLELSPELKERTAELIKDAKTDDEKMTAIYDFVAQDYRYVSLSFGLGRYQPHAASDILDNKYGDCKDKHTLFSAMMKAAGFRVQPVLIGSQRKLDPEVPSPSQFDHVISAIMPAEQEKKSQEPARWADTTTEIAPFGLLTYNIRKKQALLVGLDGPSRLIETPPNPPFASSQEFTVEGTVTDLGKLTAKVSATMRGDSELAMRSIFRSVAEAKWKDVAEYISYQAGIGGKVSDVRIRNLTNTHEPLRMEFNIARPNFLDWASKSSDLPLPLPSVPLASSNGVAEDDDADKDADKDDSSADVDAPSATETADAAKAKNKNEDKQEVQQVTEEKPIELGSPYDLKLRLKLEIPASYKSRTPVPLSVKRDYAEYKSTYKVVGQTLTVERVMSLRARDIPAARKSDYAAFVRTVRTDEKQRFHIETANAATGAPELPKDLKADELIDSARDAMQSQNFRVALDLLKRASDKEPKNKQVWNLLGEAQMGLRQFTDAEQSFRKQINLDAFDQFAHNNLGRALWQQRRMDDSVLAFQQQLDVNPLDKDALASLGELYYEQNKYPDSAEVMEKAASLEPENAFFQANLGRAYLKLKRSAEAATAFDKAVELQPNPMLWNNIAYELADNDSSLERAQQYAESAVNSVTSALRNISVDRLTMREMASVMALGSYWDTLGWVAFKKGELDKAERYVQASWKLSQGGEVGDHLAQIYQKRGRNDEAIRLFAQALSGNRPKLETREHLAQLVSDKAKLDKLVSEQKSQLVLDRTYNAGNLSPKPAKADFLLVMASGKKVEAVKFISGSDELKDAGEKLKAVDFGDVFPDETPTRIARRGAVECDGKHECKLVLMEPEAITSVN